MPNRRPADVSAIRKLAAERVAAASLRVVAEEIGISKSGLGSFLKGVDPYSRTRARLVAWFTRARASSGRSAGSMDVDTAIAVLNHYIDAAGTEAAKQRRVREVSLRLFQRN